MAHSSFRADQADLSYSILPSSSIMADFFLLGLDHNTLFIVVNIVYINVYMSP